MKTNKQVLPLNFIGSKLSLSEFIFDHFPNEIESFADLFSGTGIFTALTRKKFNPTVVVSNDTEYFSVVFAHAWCVPWRATLQTKINQLNKIAENPGKLKGGGILHTHFADGVKRMYFTPQNGRIIDAMRQQLEIWKTDKKITKKNYYYLLACIIRAADQVANTTSTYAAFLKHYKKSAQKRIYIKPIHKITTKTKSVVFQDDVLHTTLDPQVKKCDVVYLDPPYNHRQYSDNYHVLNVIAYYDLEKTQIRDSLKTGLLSGSFKSPFCQKRCVHKAFEQLFSNLQGTPNVFMSYNNESMLTKKEVLELMSRYGHPICYEKEYKKYNSKKEQKQKSVIEYLFHMTPI
jgi:adenine-specific DNA-methyltransferase